MYIYIYIHNYIYYVLVQLQKAEVYDGETQQNHWQVTSCNSWTTSTTMTKILRVMLSTAPNLQVPPRMSQFWKMNPQPTDWHEASTSSFYGSVGVFHSENKHVHQIISVHSLDLMESNHCRSAGKDRKSPSRSRCLTWHFWGEHGRPN